MIGHRPHALAGDDGPYDQPVAGHGDHRYGPVEHGQHDHQQGRHLVQLLVGQLRQRVVPGDVGCEVEEVDRDRGYHCWGGGGGHCARQWWRRPKRGRIGRGQRLGRLLVAGFAAWPYRHDVPGSRRRLTPLRRTCTERPARFPRRKRRTKFSTYAVEVWSKPFFSGRSRYAGTDDRIREKTIVLFYFLFFSPCIPSRSVADDVKFILRLIEKRAYARNRHG